jgi:flagellar assembly protein FliH
MQLLSQPIEEQQDQIERSLLIIITRLVKAIVGRELAIDRQQISHLIQQSIEVLPVGAKNIVVGVNPLDMETVRSNCGGGFVESWSLVAEPSVQPGGCIVKSQTSFVDSTVEQRIDKVIQQFLNREFYTDEELEEDEVDSKLDVILDLEDSKQDDLSGSTSDGPNDSLNDDPNDDYDEQKPSTKDPDESDDE